MSVPRLFLDRSRELLLGEYLPKIRRCLEVLSDDDLWWRPDDHSNSVGNLLLHLRGNVRQWIVHGVGGAEDIRSRPEEFATRGGTGPEELLADLEDTLEEVDRVLAALDPAILSEPRTIQGLETTALGAVYHAVEHFSMHTGQIIYITKMRTGTDLAFYRIRDDGTVETRW